MPLSCVSSAYFLLPPLLPPLRAGLASAARVSGASSVCAAGASACASAVAGASDCAAGAGRGCPCSPLLTACFTASSNARAMRIALNTPSCANCTSTPLTVACMLAFQLRWVFVL
ncbi:hypothetical protein Deiofobo_0367 [Pseudomonas phage Deifobo]|nr:hypothetical protein Deiofobo_0367 [Pseudomonas phage Deifobo]